MAPRGVASLAPSIFCVFCVLGAVEIVKLLEIVGIVEIVENVEIWGIVEIGGCDRLLVGDKMFVRLHVCACDEAARGYELSDICSLLPLVLFARVLHFSPLRRISLALDVCNTSIPFAQILYSAFYKF